MVLRRQLAALLVALVVVVTACGGNGSESTVPARAADEQVEHVHGIGVDPRDSALYLATHTGMFSVTREDPRPRRVSDLRQDTMGFTITSDGRFLGSGHPDLRQLRRGEASPLLGLVESRDRGRTWTNVALDGGVDLHVLEAGGRSVYGIDAGTGLFLQSADGGRSWAQARPPAPVLDLAVAPDRPSHLLASTERGVYATSDGGRTWRRRSARLVGLLTWSTAGVVSVDAQGATSRSVDGGRTWTAGRALGREPAAMSSDAGRVLVAFDDGAVVQSTDAGTTWRNAEGG